MYSGEWTQLIGIRATTIGLKSETSHVFCIQEQAVPIPVQHKVIHHKSALFIHHSSALSIQREYEYGY